ncbi:hypothetical protein MRB53_040442 [Persea americana]|nr:hypothetical protein MRB53_040442 [Persea americana]
MCHVYASEEGPNVHADMMQRYITKDFCTVDPIRNYDTSPDLQLDDPSQAVWRVSKEKVAVVNTYTVVPNSTPHLPSRGTGGADDDDDDEADGSEQLSVKSSRTYHTKTGESKVGGMMYTPALTEKGRSPSRSTSPDVRTRKSSPNRSPQRQQQQFQPQQPQQGLGITGGGFTPMMRGGEHFTPVLYPPHPPDQQAYMWPSPNMMSPEELNMLANQQAAIRAQYLPSLGIPYQMPYAYEPQRIQQQQPLPPQPVLRPSPRKEQAHFNHYTYPRQEAPVMQQQPSQYTTEREESEPPTPSEQPSPKYTYKEPVIQPEEYIPSKSPLKDSAPRTLTTSPRKKTIPEAELPAPAPERRVTRSQSRSPQLKANRQLPPPVHMQAIHKSQIPMHLRGPSLLDEITFDPDTGVAMMETSALNSWLNGAPLINISPGHSRETSHVRGESVSQWLNMPGIPE